MPPPLFLHGKKHSLKDYGSWLTCAFQSKLPEQDHKNSVPTDDIPNNRKFYRMKFDKKKLNDKTSCKFHSLFNVFKI